MEMNLHLDWINIKSIALKKASFTWKRLMITSIIVNILAKILMNYQLAIMERVMERK